MYSMCYIIFFQRFSCKADTLECPLLLSTTSSSGGGGGGGSGSNIVIVCSG